MTFFSGINKGINKSNIGVGRGRGGGAGGGGPGPPIIWEGGGATYPLAPPIIHSSFPSISM